MRILVGAMHPKHVYMFKNFIHAMTRKGHTVGIVAIDKDITETLLTDFQLQHENIGKNPSSILGKFIAIPQWTYQTYKIAKAFKPDIFIGQAFPHFAYVSALFQKPYVIFEDTESAHAVQAITFPFASTIVTPSCYREHLGKKHVQFNGYYELAYLYPNRFTPNSALLAELGLAEGDPFIIVRFVSWQASHDVGHNGLTLDTKRKAIREFEKYGRVFITSEKPLPEEFEKYRISVPLEKMHDLLYYATLLYGESATMASECAALGTHAIFCDFVGRGYTDEEERKYDLVYNFKLDESNQEKSIQKAVELLQDPDLKKKGQEKRARLVRDKKDVTAFMVWFIENYPRSFAEVKTPDNKYNGCL